MKNATKGLIGSVLIIWCLLWLFSWQINVDGYRWLRILVAVLGFSMPGMGLRILLQKDSDINWLRVVPESFIISISITGFLGVLARLWVQSFSFIYWGLFLFGFICMVASFYHFQKLSPKVTPPTLPSIWQCIGILLVVIIGVFSMRTAIPSLILEDDFTYNAQLNYFQNADQYTFDFDGALSRMSIARFWIAFWPLVEAVLSQLSGLHGVLVTGIYIAPILVGLSIFAVYNLARGLGLGQLESLLAITAQLVALLRLTTNGEAGFMYFDRFPEDKVVAAFVLAPVVLLTFVELLQEVTRKKTLLLALLAGGLLWTHPVMLGMTALIAGIYGMLTLLERGKLASLGVGVSVFFILMLTPLSFRFFSTQDVYEYTMEDAMVQGRENMLKSGYLTVLENERYYGISSSITQGFPYEILALAALLGMFIIKRDRAGRFVFAAFLTLGLAMIPYTGWVIGLATSPFQLWRVTWIMPFGIATAFLIQFILKGIRFIPKIRDYPEPINKASFLLAQVLLVGLFVYILPWAHGNLKFGTQKPGFVRWYEEYIEVGEVIDKFEPSGQVLVGGPDRRTNDIIPSLTYNVELISFRNERGGGNAILWETLIGDSTPTPERLDLLRETNVTYILLRDSATWLEELSPTEAAHFTLLFENKKLKLFEFSPIAKK
jgi:hypothetical protein